MFNLLAKSKEVVRELTTTKKSVTAKEIHDDFNNESKALLSQATEDELIKAKRLKQLYAIDCCQTADFIECHDASEAIRMREAAKYYQDKYPAYKFISHDQTELLCKKYGLLLSETENFIGIIPQSNLDEITSVKLSCEDYVSIVSNEGHRYNIGMFKEAYGEQKLKEVVDADGKQVHIGYIKGEHREYGLYASLAPLRFCIAAIPSLFNLKDKLVLSDYIIIDRDPIVFCRVNHGYLIITAWGDEASIPEIVNEKMN